MNKIKKVSVSQMKTYYNCQFQWYLNYVQDKRLFSSTIFTTFGQAFHRTIQFYLDIMYNHSAKVAQFMDLKEYLLDRIKEVYREECAKNNNQNFLQSYELTEVYHDGARIIE